MTPNDFNMHSKVEVDESLVDMFRKIANDSSQQNRIVLSDASGKEWTLAELDQITEKLARYFFAKFNCFKGSCLAIYLNKRPEYVFSYIAALKCGRFLSIRCNIKKGAFYISVINRLKAIT